MGCLKNGLQIFEKNYNQFQNSVPPELFKNILDEYQAIVARKFKKPCLNKKEENKEFKDLDMNVFQLTPRNMNSRKKIFEPTEKIINANSPKLEHQISEAFSSKQKFICTKIRKFNSIFYDE